MTSARRRGLALIALCACGVVVPPVAEAQLDAGARYLSEADFERAERAFDRALESGSLTRSDLVAIYEGRAMARWALGEHAGARADLAALASLDPEHRLPPEAPPPLLEAFADLPRAGLALVLSWDDDATGTTRLRVFVRNDAAALVRAVRVHARRRGEPWSTTEERSVDITRPPDVVVEAWVEALGPGGAALAHEGTALAPIEHGGAMPDGVRDALAAPERAPAGSGDPWLWVGVGIGAAALVALAIGIGVGVGTAQSDVTQPRAPVVVGF